MQSGGGLVGGDVGGAAAVAGGGLGPLDVEVEQLHLSGRWEEETAAGLEEESSALLCWLALTQAPATFASRQLFFPALGCRSAQPTAMFHCDASRLFQMHMLQYFTLLYNISHYCTDTDMILFGLNL